MGIGRGNMAGWEGTGLCATSGGRVVSDDLEQSAKNRKSSSWGGARPRSGPKPYGEQFKREIAKTARIMGKGLPEAATATVDLATGAYYLMVWNGRTKQYEKPRTQAIADNCVEIGGDMIRVYRELPDIRAIQVMYDRIIGKVPQPVDVTVRQAVQEVMQAQEYLILIVERYVPEERLAALGDELASVGELHRSARAAIEIEG